MSDDLLTEEVKARVPEGLKTAVAKIAKERHLKPADIIREALREYVAESGEQPITPGGGE